MTVDVRRDASAFGMRADTNRRRFLASVSVSVTLSQTPEVILQTEHGRMNNLHSYTFKCTEEPPVKETS